VNIFPENKNFVSGFVIEKKRFLCQSDFFLFGHVKHVFDGAEFPSEENLLAAIQRVLSDLTGDTLRAVFVK
jgi:hypothetical protein